MEMQNIVGYKQTVSTLWTEISNLRRLCIQKDACIAKLEKENAFLKNKLSKYEKEAPPEKDSHNSSIPPTQESIAAKHM